VNFSTGNIIIITKKKSCLSLAILQGKFEHVLIFEHTWYEMLNFENLTNFS